MLLDAGTIFDRNEAAFSAAIGTPESAAQFRRLYIEPTFEADSRAGQEIEAVYLEAAAAYQREGFIVGFKAAAQLLMSCTPGDYVMSPHEQLSEASMNPHYRRLRRGLSEDEYDEVIDNVKAVEIAQNSRNEL